MPAPAGYVDALVHYAELLESADTLKTELQALVAASLNGQASTTVINSTVQGMAVGLQITLTLEEKMAALSLAIKIFEGNNEPQSFADFGHPSLW